MKLRLPIIWKEVESLDDDELTALRALNKEPETFEEESSVVIDTEQVSSWYSNKNETIVSMKNGRTYSINMDEVSFSMLWIELTSEVIKAVEYRRKDMMDFEDEEEDQEENEDGDN